MSPFPVARRLIRFAAWLHPHIQAWRRERTRHRREADAHLQAGNWGEAEKALRVVLEEAQKRKKLPHKVGAIHMELSSTLLHLDRPDEAEQHLRQALGCFGQQTTPTLEMAARLDSYRGDFASAQQFLKQAINREEKVAKPDLSILGRLHQDLAAAYMHGGDLDSAEKFQTIALDRFEQLHGASHTVVADARWRLGNIYMKLNKYQLAMVCFEAALDVHRSTEGSDSPIVTRDLNSLAEASLETGDFSRAASEYERTLILMSRQVGTKQEDLAHVQKNLAKIYEKAGRIANAQEVLHHAIAILERSKGPELAESLELMARLFIRTGRYSDAQRPLERAQAIWMEDTAKFVEQLAANAEMQRKLQDELASIAESRRTSAESA